MTLAILLSTILVLVTVYLHQVTFFSLTTYTPRYVRNPHLRVYILVLGIFLVHMLEIAVYAGAFYIASSVMNLGLLVGTPVKGVLGYFYVSAVIYTSLGFGDILPTGHLRFMTATEAMNGLLLIAWSASFLYAAMGRYWRELGYNENGQKNN